MASYEELWEEFKLVDCNHIRIMADLRVIAEDDESDDQVKAQYRLGHIHHNAIRVHRNYTQAAQWYKKASEHRHVGAIFYLGEICELGGDDAVPHFFNAFTWYSLAIRMGCVNARLQMGENIEDNRIIEDDTIVVDAKDRVGLELSVEEKAEAEVKVQEWLDAHPEC